MKQLETEMSRFKNIATEPLDFDREEENELREADHWHDDRGEREASEMERIVQ